MNTSSKQLAYRQELDILENLESALNDCTNVEDILTQVADQWPDDVYTLRVIQWLHAGSPDLDEIGLGVDVNTQELIGADSCDSITKSIHAMLGYVLYGIAYDYIYNVIDCEDHPLKALNKTRTAIAKHRADLMQHDGYAMTPPYQFGVFYSYDKDYRIHVTAHD